MLVLLARLFEGTCGVADLRELAGLCAPWNNFPTDEYNYTVTMSKLRVAMKEATIPRSEWPVWVNGVKSAQNVTSYIQDILNESTRRVLDDEFQYEIDQAMFDMARDPRNTRKRSRDLVERLRVLPIGSYVDGKYYDYTAYALYEDKEDPKTWELRITESDGSPYAKGLRDATMYVVESCKSGKNADKAMCVKRAIERLHVGSTHKNRIPLNDRLEITEAQTKGSGVISIVVIQPGLTVGGERFYSRETLAEAVELFEGAKMFMNHATDQQEYEHPEGDLSRWVAILEKVRLGKGGEIQGSAVIIDPAFKEKVDLLVEQKKLNELKVSINAIGEGAFEEIADVEVFSVKRILAVRSVDFVTEANAGGTSVMESLAYTDDVDLIAGKAFMERRPDIVKLITEAKSETGKDELMNLEERFKAMEDSFKVFKESSEKEVTALTEKLTASEEENKKLKEGAIADVAIAKIKGHIDGLKITDDLKEHLSNRYEKFSDAEHACKCIDEDLKLFAKPVKESAGVKDLGDDDPDEDGTDNDNDNDDDADVKAIVESYTRRFIREGLDKEAATKKAEEMAAIG